MRTVRSTGDQYAAEILRTIKRVREENKACTAKEVSRLMRETHNLVVRQLDVLRSHGYVKWTQMPGSLVVTPEGGKYIIAVEAGATPLADAKRARLEAEETKSFDDSRPENAESPPLDPAPTGGSLVAE